MLHSCPFGLFPLGFSTKILYPFIILTSRSAYSAHLSLRVEECKWIWNWAYTGCSERRLIGHSLYCRNFFRKSCATCWVKYRRAASRTEKSDRHAEWTLCMHKGWAIKSSPCTATFSDLLCLTPCILDDKNSVARQPVLRSLISLHNEHPVENRCIVAFDGIVTFPPSCFLPESAAKWTIIGSRITSQTSGNSYMIRTTLLLPLVPDFAIFDPRFCSYLPIVYPATCPRVQRAFSAELKRPGCEVNY
jgi:hypothetical protein